MVDALGDCHFYHLVLNILAPYVMMSCNLLNRNQNISDDKLVDMPT